MKPTRALLALVVVATALALGARSASAHVDLDPGEPEVVTWSGGPVPDGVEAHFPVEVALPDAPGVAFFPAIQTTEAGDLAWIAQEEGEDGDEESNPAPRLLLVEDPEGSATTTTAPTTTETTTTETTTTTSLPATTLQAGDRGEGGPLAPWVIGGAIAALALVVGGGLLLRRSAGDPGPAGR